MILSALLLEKVSKDLESLASCEHIGQLISLKQVHQREGVGLLGDSQITSHLDEETHELFGLLLAVFIPAGPIT